MPAWLNRGFPDDGGHVDACYASTRLRSIHRERMAKPAISGYI